MQRRRTGLFALALSLSLVLSPLAGCGGPQQPAASPRVLGGATPAQGEGQAQAEGGGADPLEGWEKIRDEDGIRVFRKEIEGSPLVAFRGEGEIDAPIARVALVQMDVEHTPEWVEKLVESKLIEAKSDTDFLTYSHIGAPILVSDRDFLNSAHIDYAPPSKITIHLQSVEDARVPKTDHVRGQLLGSVFEFTAVTPTKTRVVCEIHADPKGSIPKSVVNLFQKGWAYKTITQMRKQVQRADVVERAPQVKQILARNGFPN